MMFSSTIKLLCSSTYAPSKQTSAKCAIVNYIDTTYQSNLSFASRLSVSVCVHASTLLLVFALLHNLICYYCLLLFLKLALACMCCCAAVQHLKHQIYTSLSRLHAPYTFALVQPLSPCTTGARPVAAHQHIRQIGHTLCPCDAVALTADEHCSSWQHYL
jgi:hypothetical protein